MNLTTDPIVYRQGDDVIRRDFLGTYSVDPVGRIRQERHIFVHRGVTYAHPFTGYDWPNRSYIRSFSDTLRCTLRDCR